MEVNKKLILFAFIFSGIAALIFEVVWTRPLQFILGSTIYTVSILFAAFMGGLALGSWIISKYVDKIKNLPRAYALMLLGISIYGLLLLLIFNILPDVYRAIYPLRENFYFFEFLQFILAFAVLLVPTTLMGMTFPVVAKFYTEEKIGKGVGEIYAADNLGAIIGSFAAGFLLVPLLGIKWSIIIASTINLFIGFMILVPSSPKSSKKIVPVVLVLFLILAIFANYDIEQIHTGGFYGTSSPKETVQLGKTIYYEEGLHATVTVRELSEGGTALFLNGKGQGSTVITDLRVNFLLSYLPLLLKPESENALVIGLGTGTTSGQLVQFVDVTTVEIESAVVDASREFWFMNFNVLDNPNHNLVIDDGRNYLLKTEKKYDIIVPEPCDPWQSFSTALYSKEFFELGKEHLTDNGVYMQWVPIYELDEKDFKSFYRTFNSVFPYVMAFANVKEDEEFPVPIRFKTSEIIFVGSKQKITLDGEKINNNFDALPEQIKEGFFKPISIDSGDDIVHLFLFTNEDLEGYADDARFVTDDNALLEFSTSKKMFSADSGEVIESIENYLEKKGE